MNKRVSGTLSAVLMTSVVLGGVGFSSSSVDAKTSNSPTLKSSVSKAKEKKVVSDYVKKAKTDLTKKGKQIGELKQDTLDTYEQMKEIYEDDTIKLMAMSPYKSDSLRNISNYKYNMSELKKMSESNKMLLSGLAKLRNSSDVSKHRKKVTAFNENLTGVTYEFEYYEEDTDNLSNQFRNYMDKQRVLTSILYGEEIEMYPKSRDDFYKMYDDQMVYDVSIGKRIDITREQYEKMDENLMEEYAKYFGDTYYNAFKPVLYKLASGNLNEAHKEYLKFSEGTVKPYIEKINQFTKNELERAYKLK